MSVTENSPDPLNILHSTKKIVDKAKYVFINESKIPDVCKIVSQQLKKGLDTAQEGFGSTGKFEDDLQLVFLENVVNFCFWPDKGKPKWQIEWPKGKITSGGWYTLKSCFERALYEKISILEVQYLADISLRDVKYIFRGIGNTTISLINNRWKNLKEAGKILTEKYNGQFINVIKRSNYNAINLVKLVYENFPSFRDIYQFQGIEIPILKRAQIVASDISYFFKEHHKPQLKRLNELTAFADYKLPQVLRMVGMIEYSKELADKIDNMIEIPYESLEEIEIRCATIWSVELIKQQMENVTAAEIDNALWLISQNIQGRSKPYHRTRTIFY